MKREVNWCVLQICFIMIIPCIGQNTVPLDAPGFSSSDPIHKSSITATSLDHIPVGAQGSHPPVWIDPFSSGTFNPSQTPFFNWDSLMTSSNMNNMAHGSGQIPTIQLGEGVPVSSVTDVTDTIMDGNVNNKDKTINGWITDVHAATDTKLPSTSIDSKQVIPVHKLDVPLANIPITNTHDGPVPSENTLPSTDMFGVDPRQLSPDNPIAIDPSLLSPENPAHADLIDFMITRDMALGFPEENVKSPAIVQDPFETNRKPFLPTVTPRDIVLPEGAVITDSNSPDTTNNKKGKSKKQSRQIMKRQRQEERQQKKALRKQNNKNRNERRQQKQELRQQAKQQRKAENQRFFSDKLVARKQRLKKQRLQQKISKHIRKVDTLHQKLEQIEQQTPPNTNNQASLDKQAFITETNEKQIVNTKGSNTQSTKIQVKAGKSMQNAQGKRRQNKRNRKVNNKRKNRKNNRNNGRKRKWNRN